MKTIKAIAVIVVLGSMLSTAMYVLNHGRMESVAAVNASDTEDAEYNRHLCERLIRFGQVAFERGQIAEAKHFFQKAITVDPTHSIAWKKYNMALLALVSEKVAEDPSYLPDFSADSGAPGGEVTVTPSRMSKETSDDDDDGC